MSVQQVKDRYFVAPLTDEEYMILRTDVAVKGLKLKYWIAQAIKERLEKIKEEV